MNKLKIVLFSAACAAIVGACASCGDNNQVSSSPKYFGYFSNNGQYLTEHAVRQIPVDTAKGLISTPVATYAKVSKAFGAARVDVSTIDEDIAAILGVYGKLTATTHYYVDGSDAEQVREDVYTGTDFLDLLQKNQYQPFAQMNVRYVYVTDGLLDFMESENETYRGTIQYLTNPFDAPYSYHTDASNQLVIQTHRFAELPSSTEGGIGSTFREDCELLFDKEGKATFWQSSLGILTSTPSGTIKQGFTFEVGFSWTEKGGLN